MKTTEKIKIIAMGTAVLLVITWEVGSTAWGQGRLTTTGHNTGDVTLGGAKNGLSISGQALQLYPATATDAGAVTTTTQTFAGKKTFNNLANFDGGTGLDVVTSLAAGPVTIVGRAPNDSSTGGLIIDNEPDNSLSGGNVLTIQSGGISFFTLGSDGTLSCPTCGLTISTLVIGTLSEPNGLADISFVDHGLEYDANVADDGASIGHLFTTPSLTASGALIAQWKNASAVEASLDKDGFFTSNTTMTLSSMSPGVTTALTTIGKVVLPTGRAFTVTDAGGNMSITGSGGTTAWTITVADGTHTCTLTGPACNATAAAFGNLTASGSCTMTAAATLTYAVTHGNCTVGGTMQNVDIRGHW